MQVPENSYAVILAGGSGSRLWPKSRKKNPKHLLKLFDDKSLLRITFERILPIIPASRVFVVTFKDQLIEAKKQLPEIPEENFISEPIAKNTALAMGVAAAAIVANFARPQLMPSLSRVEDHAVFVNRLKGERLIGGNFGEKAGVGIAGRFSATR